MEFDILKGVCYIEPWLLDLFLACQLEAVHWEVKIAGGFLPLLQNMIITNINYKQELFGLVLKSRRKI